MRMNEVQARPTYISRPLINGDELREWAGQEGFGSTLETNDMHVTIVYSKTPFVPTEVFEGELVIPAGINRQVKLLGDGGAVVLEFVSPDLQDEWQQYQDMGASHSFDEYVTHITITYDGKELNTGQMSPFTGELRFGPSNAKELSDDFDEYTEIPFDKDP